MAISLQLVLTLIIVLFLMIFLPNLSSIKIIIAFLMFVPSAAQGLVSDTSYDTGGVVNLSMVGYTSILGAFIILLIRHNYLSQRIIIQIMLCAMIIVAMRILADGADFISNKIFDNYFLPMLLALTIISTLKIRDIPEILHFMYICILIGAVIACIEYKVGQSILFHDYYLENWSWYVNIYNSSKYVAFRSCSIFGHPLTGSLYYLLGIVYLFNNEKLKKSKIMFYVQFAILAGAIFTTNSRSALLGLALYIIIYLVNNHKVGKLFAVLVAAVVLMVVVDWNGVYNTIFARDSSGSSVMVRVAALMSIGKLPLTTIIFGEGYNNTSRVLMQLGFRGNVEISYLIILMENGIVGFGAWLASIFFLYGKGMIKGSINKVNVSSVVNGMLLMIFVVGGFSNSFGDPGTLNYTIYFLLALSYIFANEPKADEDFVPIPVKNRVRIRFTLGENK